MRLWHTAHCEHHDVGTLGQVLKQGHKAAGNHFHISNEGDKVTGFDPELKKIAVELKKAKADITEIVFHQ